MNENALHTVHCTYIWPILVIFYANFTILIFYIVFCPRKLQQRGPFSIGQRIFGTIPKKGIHPL